MDPSQCFRVAYLTDLHLQPERGAEQGVLRALETALALDPAPQAVLLGGDVVMNSVSVSRERADLQWDLWDAVRRRFELPPVYACIGNQDCWGWNQKVSRCTGREPLFGKKMALRRLGLDRGYYESELGLWRLLVLDSCQQGGKHGFFAKLDEEQMGWLRDRLSVEDDRPVVVMSHIPIVAGPADFFSSGVVGPDASGDWRLPGHHIHADSLELVNLFRKHPNVKLSLAGHIHLFQRVEFGGVWFVHGPAVCAEWWRGDFLGQAPAFTVVDLFGDGRFETSVVCY